MKLESNIQHLDNLSWVKEVSDIEASQINGGNNWLVQPVMERSEESIIALRQENFSTFVKSIGEQLANAARKS